MRRRTAALCAALTLLAACGGGGGGGAAPTPTPPTATAPTISAQPASVSVVAGSAATFSVSASGTAPLAYQWQTSTDGGAAWTGAAGTSTSSSYTTPSTTAAFDGHRFRVQVSNAAGSVTSDAATLTVTPPASVERTVTATTTDSRITAIPASGEAPHVVINPSAAVTTRGRLLVFLPGTQGRPDQYSYILRAGATRGFHAIGLNYANQTAMGTYCQNSADSECYWKARNVVVFGDGTPVTGQSPVSKADSIVNRLEKLLAWMQTTYPAEGWGQFLLANGTVDWSKVVLAGHSQGGGHVGVLAKSVALSRAVYLSSPADWFDTTNSAATWTRVRPNVTPADQQFGFGSDDDPLVPNAQAFTHWDGFGMPRPAAGPVRVETSAPPFAESRQLRTALAPNPASSALSTALRYHGLTAVDVSTPVDAGGKPLFDTNGVWAYLCFR